MSCSQFIYLVGTQHKNQLQIQWYVTMTGVTYFIVKALHTGTSVPHTYQEVRNQKRRDSWQWAKHAGLYPDLLQTLNG